MARRKKPAPRSVRKSLAPAPEMPSGSQADYEAFLPLARELAESEVVPMRADLALALQNAQVGVSAVAAEQARLEKLSETNSGELAELPRLVLATIFADTQMERTGPASELQSLLARHDVLWRAGAYLFGRDVDEKVPLLQARRVRSLKKVPPAPALAVVKAS